MAASSSSSGKTRDRIGKCHCYGRCTYGVGPPRDVLWRVREAHLELDEEEARRTREVGLRPGRALLEAIGRTHAAIQADAALVAEPSSSSAPHQPPSPSPSADEQDQDLPMPSTPEHQLHPEQLSPAGPFGTEPGTPSPVFSAQPSLSPQDPAAAAHWSDEEDAMDADLVGLMAGHHHFDSDAEQDDPLQEDEDDDDDDEEDPYRHLDALSDLELDEEEEARIRLWYLSDDESEDGEAQEQERLDEQEDGAAQDGEQPQGHQEEADGQEQGGEQQRLPPEPASRCRHDQATFDRMAANYQPGPQPQRPPHRYSSAFHTFSSLDASEKATLRHLLTCIRTEATDRQYGAFAKNQQAADRSVQIYGKKRAMSILKRVTALREQVWDMCPESCMAFTGPHADKTHCTARRGGKRCGQARRDARGKPRAQFSTIPFMPLVRARFAAGQGSMYLHDRAEASNASWQSDEHIFQDWADGAVHRNLRENGLFDDERHEAFLLSTDGAQMIDQKKSHGWIVLLTSFNIPIQKRYRRDTSFISTIIPGPNNPVDLDSFLWPVLEEFARAARGFWVWDGGRREWFLYRAWIVAAGADQPGSSKINKMTGQTGFSGCKTCTIRANYAFPGQKVGHFPLSTIIGDQVRAREREEAYDPYDLPLRSDEEYEDAIEELSLAGNADERRQVQRLTGIKALSIFAACPAFTSPIFFPPDVMHLFGSNLPSLLWTTLMNPQPGDPFSLSTDQQAFFTTMLADGAKDLPGSLSPTAPRSPATSATSHYKMFEWSLCTYVYLPVLLAATDAPPAVIEMVSSLVEGVRLAMDRGGCSAAQLQTLQDHFVRFATLWEDLYVRGDPDLLFRSTISVHHLLHIWLFIFSHGSVRATSQARCEREVGLIKRFLRSFKRPYQNIANNVKRRAHMSIMDVVLIDDDHFDAEQQLQVTMETHLTSKHIAITPQESEQQQQLIEGMRMNGALPDPVPPFVLRGKTIYHSAGGSDDFTIRGSRIEADATRRACYFTACTDQGLVFGRALHFLCFGPPEDRQDLPFIDAIRSFVVFYRLEGVLEAGSVIRGRWATRLSMVAVPSILEPVGVAEVDGDTYILRAVSWSLPQD